MKAGDKLYCKKRLNFLGDLNSSDWFSVGKSYIISKVRYSYIYVIDNEGDEVLFVLNSITEFYYHKIDEYFYTMNYYRKLKLEKLNN